MPELKQVETRNSTLREPTTNSRGEFLPEWYTLPHVAGSMLAWCLKVEHAPSLMCKLQAMLRLQAAQNLWAGGQCSLQPTLDAWLPACV